MKRRFGFVSNSSSTSFIFRKSDISEDTLEQALNHLIEAYNLICDGDVVVSDICYITELDDIDEVGLKIFNFCNKNKIAIEQYKLMNGHIGVIPGIEVSSTRDNSIPFVIQEFLSELGTRYFWD